ncbi:RNA polymerase sigma factor [Desulfuromonas versatilis]|uniref:RNA polymerase sigma factor n=1 Tax=Desulfuromonas versatilis TaxID=2802975 RepID=A0ABM8HZ70_9BACT|nr:RNA polymerase sigma factor [Desulfuromonas versatilis]
MSDEELMLAYSEGDMEAFEVLYARHKSRVFGFLLTRLKNRDDAEDVFQAVFSRLHRGRHRYRAEIPFLPWLFTIARNTLIDHVRKGETYARHITSSEQAVEAYAAPEAGTDPLRTTIAQLARLNESQRRALEMRFEEGLSFAEIAQRTQTSADNARQIISRAIRRLRGLMVNQERRHENN